MTDISEFFSGVNAITDKNYGGCLWMCYAFIRWAEANDIDLSTFELVQHRNNFDENIAYFNGETDEAMSASHFTFMFEGTHYDGYGETTFPYCEHYVFNQPIDKVKEFCVKALNDTNQWNAYFDRLEARDIFLSSFGINIGIKTHRSINILW